MNLVTGFGTWKYIGQVADITEDWQLFPFFPESKNSSFWIQQIGNFHTIPKLTVRGYLRAVYFDGTRLIFDSKWVRFYPKEEPEIVEIPYPQDLIRDPLPQRQIEVKMKARFPRSTTLPQYTWGIDLYEKLDTLNVYPGDPYPILQEEEQTTQ